MSYLRGDIPSMLVRRQRHEAVDDHRQSQAFVMRLLYKMNRLR